MEWTNAEREAVMHMSCVWLDCPGPHDRRHGPDGLRIARKGADAILGKLAPFVAAREAQAAAKALREASFWLMDLPSRRGPAVYADERTHADGQDVGIELAADHLRDRADRIERGES